MLVATIYVNPEMLYRQAFWTFSVSLFRLGMSFGKLQHDTIYIII